MDWISFYDMAEVLYGMGGKVAFEKFKFETFFWNRIYQSLIFDL